MQAHARDAARRQQGQLWASSVLQRRGQRGPLSRCTPRPLRTAPAILRPPSAASASSASRAWDAPRTLLAIPLNGVPERPNKRLGARCPLVDATPTTTTTAITTTPPTTTTTAMRPSRARTPSTVWRRVGRGANADAEGSPSLAITFVIRVIVDHTRVAGLSLRLALQI